MSLHLGHRLVAIVPNHIATSARASTPLAQNTPPTDRPPTIAGTQAGHRRTAPIPVGLAACVRRRTTLPSSGMRGTVKQFNDAKGYGFITRVDGCDVFVHYSAIACEGFRTLVAGQVVDYDEQQGPRGWFAVRVAVAR
jgi:cold shock protein